MTGRSKTVTGDEPGSCKVLTGTPYAGLDQINENCNNETSEDMKSRATVNSGNNSNARLTGQQPGIGGAMTCLLYTSPSPRDATLSRMPSSA